ncbi:glycosyltransferase family 61 protein [Aureimonas frigidaquae]|uniref:glycosyltransferase family 61 protein n=1 Tax=Aureimonas frigidaquae TaxID=424757 RepID=UPI000B2AFEDD|nr:glycosyltransferase family 61 protein [Aureimonas frigidaquae]
MYYRLPLENYLRKRLRQRQVLEAAACEVAVVQPEESEWCAQPAVHLAGQLERAQKSVEGHATLQEELQACRPGLVTHAAVIRYRLRDAIVHRAGYDAPGFANRIVSRASPLMSTREGAHIERAVYCMSPVSRRYFGHWLQDACATGLMKEQEDSLFLDERPDWSHCAAYSDAFGFSPVTAPTARVDLLTVYQDHGQGSSKRARYRRMRDLLRRAIPVDKPGPKAVYLRRGATGAARLVANDGAVSDALSRRGFTIVDLQDTSVAALHASLRHARLVVSMDGSHLNHIYTAADPGTAILSFIPADRFTATNVGYCRAAGMRFGIQLAMPAPGGYQVDIDDMLRTLDLLEKAEAAPLASQTVHAGGTPSYA